MADVEFITLVSVFAGGGLCGGVAGLLVSLFESLLKDLRDSRILAGYPIEDPGDTDPAAPESTDHDDLTGRLDLSRPAHPHPQLHLPSDRVAGRYHWPLAVLGALSSVGLTLTGVFPPLWAATAILLLPATLLPVLIVMAVYNAVLHIAR